MKCFTNKDEIRKNLKTRRKALSQAEIQEKSAVICDKIYEKTVNFKSVLCYVSHMGEVDLTSLITRLLADGKTVSVPVCTENFNIIPSQIDSVNFAFSENSYKIREPKILKIPEIFPDCCIVPGVGFDVFKSRVGHGKGYYDRFLSENPMYKIGACYDFQIVDKIDASKLDIKMDCVISEKRII